MTNIVERARRWLPILQVPLLMTLAGFDPYSFGRTGGDLIFPTRYWQILVTIAMIGFLTCAAALAMKRRFGIAFLFLVFEVTIFVGVNFLYVSLDGFETRTQVGYASTNGPLYATIAAFFMRVLTISVVGFHGSLRSQSASL
jgi:hypothetical protein